MEPNVERGRDFGLGGRSAGVSEGVSGVLEWSWIMAPSLVINCGVAGFCIRSDFVSRLEAKFASGVGKENGQQMANGRGEGATWRV